MTSGMRVTPTNAEPGERRQVSNILDAVSVAGEGCPYRKYLLQHTAEAHRQFRSITWAVLGCRVASSPSDEERSVSLGSRTSAAVDCASICDGCCRVFDGRPWSLPKRAVSCPEAGQVASRRTMWVATHLVCRLIFKPSSQDIAASRAWC